MNIGIFTECYKPTINGVVMSIEASREELEKRGHRVFIFCPKYKEAEFQPNVFRIPSITMLSPKDYPIGIPYFSHLLPIISRLNLDVIHTQHIFLMGRFGQTTAKKLNIPSVHTYHTMMTEYAHYFPIKIFQKMVKEFIIAQLRTFCNKAGRVIVPSSPMVKVLRSYGVKTPLEILPTGVDLKRFKRLNPKQKRIILKKYDIPLDKKILIYVGRLAREKNLGFLVDCFGEISKRETGSHLVFVGSGPDEENLKLEIKKLKLEGSITMTGFLPKPETNQFFGLADLFVFPSVTETQGLVLVESLATGLPAVAINQLGPRDVVKNGQDGYLVPLNQKEFTSKVLKLLTDEKLRKKFSQKAKINVKRFAIEKCTDRLIKIYENVKAQSSKLL